MSNKKLKFSVDDFSIEENETSHFAILDMKIVSSGMNAHRLPITEDAIKNASPSLYGKPVLTHYIEEEDALGGHDPEEIPIGVFLNNETDITKEDGTTWLSAKAYVWKKYFPHVLEVFRKNDGKTNISMEIEVLNSNFENDGYEWIKEFSFLGVTAIGVTPAITGSGGTVLQFSDLMNKATKEFSSRYASMNFEIPSAVKKNAKKGLELRGIKNRGGTSVSLALARHLIKNEKTDEKRIRQMGKFFKRDAPMNLEDKESDDWINWQLWGGSSGKKWSLEMCKNMELADNDRSSFFSADGLVADTEIEFERTEETLKMAKNKTKEEEKPVEDSAEEEKKESPEAEKEEDEKSEKFQVEEQEPKKEEMSEAPEEEKPEGEEKPEEEEKSEGDEEEKTSMSMDAYADVPAMLGMIALETEQVKEMFAEMGKAEEKDFSVISNGLYFMLKEFAKRYAEIKAKEEEKEKEFAELKKFKSDSEEKSFQDKVEMTLSEVKEFISADEYGRWAEESKKFSLENVSEWETKLKASLFTVFSKKITKEEDNNQVKRMSLPFNETKKQNSNNIW